MDERKYQIAGLCGFIASGGLYLTVGIQSRDTLSIIGSALWVASCFLWLIPLLKKP